MATGNVRSAKWPLPRARFLPQRRQLLSQVMRQRTCPTPARVWVLNLLAEMGSLQKTLLWAIFYHTDMESVGTYK